MKFTSVLTALFTLSFISGCVNKTPKITEAAKNEPSAVQAPPEKIVLTVGKREVSEKEFERDLKNIPEIDSVDLDELTRQIIWKKQLVMEARGRSLDKDPDLLEEIETYSSILSKSYLTDSVSLNRLMLQSYSNYQKEINASHIFIPVSKYASPEDTLKVYNDLISLRKTILADNNFEAMAAKLSKDTRTSEKGGHIGWFSTYQLIYPLEQAAYGTTKGSVSLPVRTPQGYHLVKVNDVRKNSGRVQVQHIFKYVTSNTPSDSVKAKSLMDSLYTEIQNGADFNEICLKYSDDASTRNSYGELPVFGIGTREEEAFEEAAFGLKEGAVSLPVRTANGFHLIRLIKRLPPETREEFLERTKYKLTTDSRGVIVTRSTVSKLKEAYGYTVNEEVLLQCIQAGNKDLPAKKWKYVVSPLSDQDLLRIEDRIVKAGDFLNYVQERQQYDISNLSYTPEMIMRQLFENFEQKLILEYGEKRIRTENQELKKLVTDHVEELLASRIINDRIYEVSIADTLGQRRYYNAHKEQFFFGERAAVETYTFSDSGSYLGFQSFRNKEKPYQLMRGIQPIFLTKNSSDLSVEDQRKLMGLILIMSRNPGYIVEIGGHADANESLEVSAARIRKTVGFLTENGLSITKIREYDYQKSKPLDRFDWIKNQRISFQFFSNLEEDLMKVFNEKAPGAITRNLELIPKEEIKKYPWVQWKEGTFSVKKDGKIIESTIRRILPKMQKTLKEARVEVINGYQSQLQKQLSDELSVKYPVDVRKEDIQKIYKDIKSKN